MKFNVLRILRAVTYCTIVMIVMMIADLSHADVSHNDSMHSVSGLVD